MSSELAIAVEHLSKCYHIYERPHDRLFQMLVRGRRQFYQEFWALRDVSFEIRRGETVGIIGRNGSGKSTLLQMICGTVNPTAGQMRTNGRVAALLELGSGFNPEFTGRENVYLNASVLGLSRLQTDDRFASIEAFADIGVFIDQPVKTYSSGMMLRLAFAVIAHVDADILVIDEALAVGDAFFTQKCMRFLRDFMQTGTVLFVSHDTSAVMSLCNRAIWLNQGSVLQDGSPKEVCEHYLQTLFENQQGKSAVPRSAGIDRRTDAVAARKDQRAQFINASNLRNDLQVFPFDPASTSFGKGGAQIAGVEFLDESGTPLAWIVGGEQVTLRVRVIAHELLDAPIIGFTIKDKFGQNLFGDNTYLSHLGRPMVCRPGQQIQADFSFQIPILPVGDYSVNAAVANGTQADHIQHHWMHDALVFRSESTSVSTGLVGIPMLDIQLNVIEEKIT